MNKQKKWTILFYANGNNEFEPEMYQAILDAQKIGSNSNINIIFQIGRVKRELVKILRPSEQIEDIIDSWNGVRRYYVTKKVDNNANGEEICSVLLKDLGQLNMADPKVLYDFIEWGMGNYPAEKYMLIMGGHSFEYLGIMPDYGQILPYIMGIPEMCKALNLMKKNTGKEIDLLVLDTCYMNMVEILYELAKDKNHTVKNVLTYIEHGPIRGLPIDKLIEILEANITTKELDKLLVKIIEDLDLDLIAFSLNNKKLERIKRIANDLATKVIKNEEYKKIKLSKMLELDSVIEGDLFQEQKELRKGLKSLIINYKRVSNYQSFLLDIAHKQTNNKLAAYYFRLSFVKNNDWPLLLNIYCLKDNLLSESIQLKPLSLPLQALVSLISVMNPTASEKDLELILQKLIEYKKWTQFTNVKLKPQMHTDIHG